MNFKTFMKGSYKAYMKCPNCGFGSGVKIPKGISVLDFVKGGQCKCDNCLVVFYPKEYTTEHFEKDKNTEYNKDLKVKSNFNKSNIDKENIKW